MTAPAEPMAVRGGVGMLRCQYLAGMKETAAASYPTVPRLDVNVEAPVQGNIDALASSHPDLLPCLYNDVKTCPKCGKPCAFTLKSCNACGMSLLETPMGKSENIFSAFAFGVQSSTKGFAAKISLRRETDEVLIFDDLLALSPLHFNCISKQHYVPDWRYLLTAPVASLALLDLLEKELWEASQPFIQNAEWRSTVYREAVTDEDIRKNVITCFNFPPSQFHLHVQWIVPPLTPFQHYMGEIHNHFHEGRAFPLSYVRRLLELNKPYDVRKETPVEEIMEYYREWVDYKTCWEEWVSQTCLPSTLKFQNWNPDDFEYVVQDGKVHTFTVVDSKVELGDEVSGVTASDVQTKDKAALQNYGRPYDANGKPSGTYIQNALLPKFGPGGYSIWNGVQLPDAAAPMEAESSM